MKIARQNKIDYRTQRPSALTLNVDSVAGYTAKRDRVNRFLRNVSEGLYLAALVALLLMASVIGDTLDLPGGIF